MVAFMFINSMKIIHSDAAHYAILPDNTVDKILRYDS